MGYYNDWHVDEKVLRDGTISVFPKTDTIDRLSEAFSINLNWSDKLLGITLESKLNYAKKLIQKKCDKWNTEYKLANELIESQKEPFGKQDEDDNFEEFTNHMCGIKTSPRLKKEGVGLKGYG